jgi:toxin ParE1/3/4
VSLQVVMRPEASRDAEDARNYFDAQRAAFGQTFLIRLDDTLARIGAMPETYATVWRNVRAARLRQFPYVVYYRIGDERVEVLAVMHGSRDASAWRTRD